MAFPSLCPGARWFSTAAVEGDRGGACQSRGGSDASAAGAGSLGRGPAREPDGRDPGREDRSLPVCQEYHGSTSHQRPPGAQVHISLLSWSSSFSKFCSDFMLGFFKSTLVTLFTRTWVTDLPKGACALVCTSVDHDGAAVVGVRVNVFTSRYYIEPCGGNKSRLTHISRIDCR